MRILSKYVLREFLTPVFYCLIGFSLIYLIVELFGESDRILQARPPPTVVLAYLLGFLATILQWLLPAALLLGGLYSMWQLARHSEITAMRATGIGFGTITAPILWAAVGFAVLLALNSEFYAPEGSRISRQIKANRFMPVTNDHVYLDVPYHNVADRREWRIARLDLDANSAGPLRITWTDDDGRPQRILDAERADYLDGVWWFQSPVFTETEMRSGLSQPMPGSQTRDLIAMPELSERPRDFFLELMQTEEDRETLSLRDMIRYVKARPRLTRAVKVGWRYDIYYRLVAPWGCLVITLFAIPAGVATGRQSVFIGVVSAVAMFFSFYALTLICGGMAKKDIIPVGVGVLLPNLVFLISGLILFHRQR